MNILIIGAAGMLGRKLVHALIARGTVLGRPISRLVLSDIIAPERPAFDGEIETIAADLSQPGTAEQLIASRPDLICHLAAIVSGEAEADFEKGYRVNLDGTRALFEAIRLAGQTKTYCPKVVFTSSIVVFGEPLPAVIGDDQCLTPLTSYGTQKAIGELLLADYSRRGFLDGIGIRLPTISIRPGKPNKAASGFFSSILREPLIGEEAVLPVSDTVRHWFASPRAAVDFIVHACELDTEKLGIPPHSDHAGSLGHRRRPDRGPAPRGRRRCRKTHSPRGQQDRCRYHFRLATGFQRATRRGAWLPGRKIVR